MGISQNLLNNIPWSIVINLISELSEIGLDFSLWLTLFEKENFIFSGGQEVISFFLKKLISSFSIFFLNKVLEYTVL